MERYEVEQIAYEEAKAVVRRSVKRGSFYDDYESDCIELWDAIEKLQEEVKRLNNVVRVLRLKNGIITKKEAIS